MVLAAGAPAHAGATKCRSAIVKASSAFVQLKARALLRCWDKVSKGKLPGPCPDFGTDAAIGKARAKGGDTINKACGGKDKVCGTGTVPDETLASIGWNIGSCAAVGDGTCTNAIEDCNDIGDCVACISDKAVDGAFELYFDPVAIAGSDKALKPCLQAIGTFSTSSLLTMSKAFGGCWLAVNKADSGGSFSCPDADTAVVVAKAKRRIAAAICNKCGGADHACGDADDVARENIGFPATCPAIGTCGGPVQTLRDIASCADCVTGVLVDRAARSSIPAYSSSSPPQCVPGPTPTPGG